MISCGIFLFPKFLKNIPYSFKIMKHHIPLNIWSNICIPETSTEEYMYAVKNKCTGLVFCEAYLVKLEVQEKQWMKLWFLGKLEAPKKPVYPGSPCCLFFIFKSLWNSVFLFVISVFAPLSYPADLKVFCKVDVLCCSWSKGILHFKSSGNQLKVSLTSCDGGHKDSSSKPGNVLTDNWTTEG